MIPISSTSTSLAGQLLKPPGISLEQLEQPAGSGSTQKGAAASGPQSFGKALSSFVSDVDTQIKASGEERAKVFTGETTNLHQAMIASQEASIGFTFMVELRNKLVESYQELMRSQV